MHSCSAHSHTLAARVTHLTPLRLNQPHHVTPLVAAVPAAAAAAFNTRHEQRRVQRQHAHAHSKHVEVQQLQRRSVDVGVGHTEAAGRVRMNTSVAHVCVRGVYTGVCTL